MRIIIRRDVFQAMADPSRRAILSLIALRAMTPNAIAEHFDSSRQAISKHLKISAECKLKEQEHDGREIYYYPNPKKLKEIDRWPEQFGRLWESRFDKLDSVLKQILITRLFNATPDIVWNAWTEPEFLDQWWAPEPWTDEKGSMDFREREKWSYAMVSPEGRKHLALVIYTKISTRNFFEGKNSFCDDSGNVNTHCQVRIGKLSFVQPKQEQKLL